MSRIRATFIAALICSLPLSACRSLAGGDTTPTLAQPQSEGGKVATTERSYVDGPLTIDVADLSPRFLDFYSAAQELSPDARFAAWKARYGFAALPPRDDFDQQARMLLDAAWDRYPAALPTIRAGEAGMVPPVPFGKIARLLGLDAPAKVKLVTYVGGFEDNAYTMMQDGVPTLNLPLESPREFRELVGSHEAVHAIHMLTAGLDGNYERPVAQMLIEEGLAMRATQALVAGRPESAYVEHKPGWFNQASARRAALLANFAPLLGQADGQTIFNLTGGTGTTGLQREAYYVGWLVVGDLQRQGMTLAQIAHVKPDAMGALVRDAIGRLAAAGG